MKKYQYDLIIIGGGSAGVRSARRASEYGKKVALIEKGDLGGTCVNKGCIPKKLFSYSAHISDQLRHAKGFGWTIDEMSFDWKQLVENKNKEIQRLNEIYFNILKNHSVDYYRGEAHLISSHIVEVNGEKIESTHILLATGGKPKVLNFSSEKKILYSDDIFYLKKLPKAITIIGSGYIAVEMAYFLNAFGVEVNLVVRGESVLSYFDQSVQSVIQSHLVQQGIQLHFNASIVSIEKLENSQVNSVFSNGLSLLSDEILCAIGREPNLSFLKEESLIDFDSSGLLKVDENYQTSMNGVYALGDLINHSQLTPIAIQQAEVLMDYLFRLGESGIGFSYIPTAVFTYPSIGCIGLTEKEASLKYDVVDIYEAIFSPLSDAFQSNKSVKCLVKIVVCAITDQVLGVHMVSNEAAEVIQGVAIAMETQILKKSHLDMTLAVHPTISEELTLIRLPVRKYQSGDLTTL